MTFSGCEPMTRLDRSRKSHDQGVGASSGLVGSLGRDTEIASVIGLSVHTPKSRFAGRESVRVEVPA